MQRLPLVFEILGVAHDHDVFELLQNREASVSCMLAAHFKCRAYVIVEIRRAQRHYEVAQADERTVFVGEQADNDVSV